MKLYPKIILCLFAIHSVLEAQIIPNVSTPTKLDVPGYAQGPVLSPDGKRLAFSREQYDGVEILDLEKNTIEKICSHVGSGWGMTWLDNKSIIARSIKEGTTFRNRQMGLELIDVVSKKESAVIPFAAPNRIEVPRKASTGSVAVWNNRQLSVIYPDRSVLQKKSLQGSETFPSYEQGKILSGTNIFETPTKRAVLSMVWSPDGTKALVELLGQPSLYLMNSATGKFQMIANKGEHPAWVNNDLCVYVETTDDGHRVVNGDIFLASLDGRKQNLTERFDRIALNPTASQDGKIAFNTMDGELY